MDDSVPNKPRRMINYLMESIHSGKLGEGTQLPTIRELMSEFRISYGSVKRGIDYLQAIGLIDKRMGSGTFVSKKRKKRGRRVSNERNLAVFLNAHGLYGNPGVYHTAFLGIQRMGEELGWSLTTHYLDKKTACWGDVERMSEGADGIVFLAEYDLSLKDFAFKVPAVGLCMHSVYPGNASVVDLDPFASARMAVEHFNKREIRKVIAVGNEHPAYQFRVEIFADVWRTLGGDVTMVSEGETINFNDKTGYLFATGSILQNYSLKYEKKAGEYLSKKNHVIGLDGKNRVDPSFHPAPTIWIDWQMAGKCVFEECLRRVDTPGVSPRRIYIPGHFAE